MRLRHMIPGYSVHFIFRLAFFITGTVFVSSQSIGSDEETGLFETDAVFNDVNIAPEASRVDAESRLAELQAELALARAEAEAKAARQRVYRAHATRHHSALASASLVSSIPTSSDVDIGSSSTDVGDSRARHRNFRAHSSPTPHKMLRRESTLQDKASLKSSQQFRKSASMPATGLGSSDFGIGDRVKMRDKPFDDWKHGIVTSIEPLRIRASGMDSSFEWLIVERMPRAGGAEHVTPASSDNSLIHQELQRDSANGEMEQPGVSDAPSDTWTRPSHLWPKQRDNVRDAGKRRDVLEQRTTSNISNSVRDNLGIAAAPSTEAVENAETVESAVGGSGAAASTVTEEKVAEEQAEKDAAVTKWLEAHQSGSDEFDGKPAPMQLSSLQAEDWMSQTTEKVGMKTMSLPSHSKQDYDRVVTGDGPQKLKARITLDSLQPKRAQEKAQPAAIMQSSSSGVELERLPGALAHAFKPNPSLVDTRAKTLSQYSNPPLASATSDFLFSVHSYGELLNDYDKRIMSALRKYGITDTELSKQQDFGNALIVVDANATLVHHENLTASELPFFFYWNRTEADKMGLGGGYSSRHIGVENVTRITGLDDTPEEPIDPLKPDLSKIDFVGRIANEAELEPILNRFRDELPSLLSIKYPKLNRTDMRYVAQHLLVVNDDGLAFPNTTEPPGAAYYPLRIFFDSFGAHHPEKNKTQPVEWLSLHFKGLERTHKADRHKSIYDADRGNRRLAGSDANAPNLQPFSALALDARPAAATGDDDRPSLAKLFEQVGTERYWRHGYHRFYERELAPYRDKRGLRLLELGGAEQAQQAALLADLEVQAPRMDVSAWLNYFSDLEAIYGVTVGESLISEVTSPLGCDFFSDERCRKVREYKIPKVSRGNIQELFRKGSTRRISAMDIIIDSGLGSARNQLMAFTNFFPTLRPGGLYVIEGTETSYAANLWHKNSGHVLNTVGMFKTLVDLVNGGHTRHPDLTLFGSRIDPEVARIGFGDGIIFVEKKRNDDGWNRPYSGRGQRSDFDNFAREWQVRARETVRELRALLASEE